MANGITSPIPVLEWFIADADYNDDHRPTRPRTSSACGASPTTAGHRQRRGQHQGARSQTTPRSTGSSTRRSATTSIIRPGRAGRRVRHAGRLERHVSRSRDPVLGRLRASRRRQHQMFPVRTQRNAPSRASTPTWTPSTAPGATARATTTTSSSRPTPARSSTVPLVNVPVREEDPDTTTSRRSPRSSTASGLTGNAQRTTCWATPTSRR